MKLDIDERYMQIDGYDEYFITEYGNVYAVRNRGVGWQGVRKLSPKGRNNPNRYLQVCLSNADGKKYHQIHRLVAKHFCQGYFGGAVVNHIDGDIHNNVFTNLEWITQKENIHKSYVSSGVNQVRNYKYYNLKDPNGKSLGVFVGRNDAQRYIKENNIEVSCTSLVRYGRSGGYTLTSIAEAVTTIS